MRQTQNITSTHRQGSQFKGIRLVLFGAIILSCFVSLNAQTQSSSAPQIPQSVVAGGGGTSGAGSSQVEGTMCQPVVGTSIGGSFKLEAGFWPGGTIPAASALTVDDVTGNYGGAVSLTARLTATGASLSGKSISFALNGATVGTATTGSDGVATLNNVSLAGINAGTYPDVVTVQFAGDSILGSSSDAAQLTVGKANPVLQVAGGTFAYDGQAHPASASVAGVNGEVLSPLTVLYNGSGAGQCGTYSITTSFPGNQNYNTATNNLRASLSARRIRRSVPARSLTRPTAIHHLR